jgi:ABC-type transporter Mla subunit MlaD
LAGRPGDLSDVLRRAHPALRETSETLGILGRQTDTIEKFIGDAHTVVGALEDRKRDVSRFVREAGETAEISASRREQLGESFRRLPAFLTELDPYMGRLGDLTEAQTPVLRDLQSASDELDTFLTRLRPFTAEGLPAFKALGEASVVGRRAVRKTDEEIRELRRLAKDAPGFAKPLRQLLQTIDDRRRAVEPDRRAAASGPPAGDKTHTTSNRAGFTGMEAIWNYFFWQTLSINMLDNDAHMLRASLSAVPECIPFRNSKPDPETLKKCNSYLGPNQPGITTADPLDDGSNPSAASVREQSGQPASRLGERRDEGQPEAGPLPGQPDLSKPQIALPPPVQNLLDDLSRRQRNQLKSNPDELQNQLDQIGVPSDDQTTGQLLDYLLAP